MNKANPGGIRLHLHHMPAHIGINGYEAVDAIAIRMGVWSNVCEDYNKISKENIEIYVRIKLRSQWRDSWKNNSIRAEREWHLRGIIGDIPKQPRYVMSNRNLDSMITIMRIGHIESNSYLKKVQG